MEIYNNKIYEKARKLYKTGLSYRQVSQELKINDGTIRRWCNDIKSESTLLSKNEKQRQLIKNEESKVASSVVIDRDMAKILAAMLYWAEGTKYPQSTAVSFSNSDPNMVSFFVKLLRTAYKLDEKKFKIHLQIHTTQKKSQIFGFWSKLLGVPVTQFWKPTVTKPTNNMKRVGYMGTCTVRYHDYRVLLGLIAIYESLSCGGVA